MNDEKPPKGKRTRVTMEKQALIRQYYREGLPTTEIAKKTGLHRHTVRTYIKEKFEDVVADEARKQVLMDGLKQHYDDLAELAQVNLRSRLNASVPESKKEDNYTKGAVSTNGLMALPYTGGPNYMVEEWERMYTLSPREKHLMPSLKTHTKMSALWAHLDRWRKMVSVYEDSSKKMWEWLEGKIEEESKGKYQPPDSEELIKLAFGNILRITDSDKADEIELVTKYNSVTQEITPTVKSKDSPFYIFLRDVINEARGQQCWSSLMEATTSLKDRQRQQDLKNLAGKIDDELISIELMHVFSGRCELCPV